MASHTSVISNLIEFQSKHAGEEKGRKEFEARIIIAKELKQTRKRDMWYRILTMIGLAIAIYFGVINSKKNNSLGKRIEDLGSPVVTDSRGQMLNVPDGAGVRFWPKDFMGDTVKTDTKK
mgnify:FL=1